MSKLRAGHILVLVVALVLLGALAWGVGWVAHSLMVQPTPLPAATTTPTVLPTSAPTVAPILTAEPTQASTESVTSTPVPTSTPAPTITPSPTPAFILHTVRWGDTLYSLARRYGTTVEAIRAANGLRSDRIRIGQTLKIPLDPTWP